MLLRSERRERRLRRTRPVTKTFSAYAGSKKPSSSPGNAAAQKITTTTKSVVVNSKCNTVVKSSITPRVSASKSRITTQKKSSSRILKIVNKKTNKIADDSKENCWLVEQTEVTLFDEPQKSSKSQKEGNTSNTAAVSGVHDVNNTVEDIGSPCDSRNQFGPIVLNTAGSSTTSSVVTPSCCSCDAEGLSSSRHTRKSAAAANTSNVILKCISECDSTTGFDSDDDQNSLQIDVNQSLAGGIEGDDNNASDKSIFDGIVPEVDSTTDLLAVHELIEPDNDSTSEKTLQLPKLILPSSFNHTFPTPDITPSSRQFPCYNTLTNNYSTSSEALISFFDEVINNKNAATDLVNQYTDYTAYSSYFSHGLNLSDNDLTAASMTAASSSTQAASLLNTQSLLNLDQQHNAADLSFLTMHQTAIDNLKALSNFQAQNFLNLSSSGTPQSSLSIRGGGSADGCCTSDVEMDVDVAAIVAHESFIQSVQQSQLGSVVVGASDIDRPSCMYNNNNDDLSSGGGSSVGTGHDDIRLETDECMEIEEVDARQISAANIFDPYFFIKNLPPLTPDMRAKCPALPLKTRSSPEFTLVLDLDETLVHCSLQELSDASFKFPVLFQVSEIGLLLIVLNN